MGIFSGLTVLLMLISQTVAALTNRMFLDQYAGRRRQSRSVHKGPKGDMRIEQHPHLVGLP